MTYDNIKTLIEFGNDQDIQTAKTRRAKRITQDQYSELMDMIAEAEVRNQTPTEQSEE